MGAQQQLQPAPPHAPLQNGQAALLQQPSTSANVHMNSPKATPTTADGKKPRSATTEKKRKRRRNTNDDDSQPSNSNATKTPKNDGKISKYLVVKVSYAYYYSASAFSD